MEFGEWLCGEVLKAFSHRHFVFSIPKILKHLGLWPVVGLKVERDRKPRSPTKATGPPKPIKCTFDYSISQLPDSDKWLYVDVEYRDATPS